MVTGILLEILSMFPFERKVLHIDLLQHIILFLSPNIAEEKLIS